MGDANREALQRAAKVAREQVDDTVRKNIEAIKKQNIERNWERYGCPDCAAAECYLSCPRYLTNCEPGTLFYWWGKTSPKTDFRDKQFPGR